MEKDKEEILKELGKGIATRVSQLQKEILNIDSISEFAKKAMVSANTLTKIMGREKQTEEPKDEYKPETTAVLTYALLCIAYKVNLNWLILGIGDPLISDEMGQEILKKSSLIENTIADSEKLLNCIIEKDKLKDQIIACLSEKSLLKDQIRDLEEQVRNLGGKPSKIAV